MCEISIRGVISNVRSEACTNEAVPAVQPDGAETEKMIRTDTF